MNKNLSTAAWAALRKHSALTVVTDVGFSCEEPSLWRILGFRFSKRDSIHSGPARYFGKCYLAWLYTNCPVIPPHN